MYSTINKFTKLFFRDLTSLGSLVFYVLLLVATLVWQEYRLFLVLTFGLLFTLLAIVIIRLFYFKDRPKKQQYNNIIDKIDASSFPSLHSARVTFLCLLFVMFFSKTYVIVFFLLLAVLVIYSRIYLKKHDGFDVLGGVVLGVVTYLITLLF